jgi:hypothetical protein
MKGHARIVVTGANETTYTSVFTVGRANAHNQGLFPEGMTYDGMADIANVAIASTNGRFGGLLTANATYVNTMSVAGVYAPGVTFSGPVYVGDISATGDATPMFYVGSAPIAKITGGDLLQANARAVQVKGLTTLEFSAGSTSGGDIITPKFNRARLEQDGTDVTRAIAP